VGVPAHVACAAFASPSAVQPARPWADALVPDASESSTPVAGPVLAAAAAVCARSSICGIPASHHQQCPAAPGQPPAPVPEPCRGSQWPDSSVAAYQSSRERLFVYFANLSTVAQGRGTSLD